MDKGALAQYEDQTNAMKRKEVEDKIKSKIKPKNKQSTSVSE